jgi:hypothetical protein
MKVISGGQTGVDRFGLEVARAVGIPTGGTAPKNYWTDTGSDKTLKEYGVVEANVFGYPYRTEKNVENSDGTVLFGDLSSPGCQLTIKICRRLKKPYIENPTPEQLFQFILFYEIATLNVAGNRLKNLSRNQQSSVKEALKGAFSMWKEYTEK